MQKPCTNRSNPATMHSTLSTNTMHLSKALPLAILVLSACSSQPTTMPTVPEPTDTAPATDVSLLSGKQTVVLKTSKGDMTFELDADAAPKTVTNFVTHAKNGYYDNLTFHRVIKDFMIQGGDPDGTGRGGESIWGSDFEDEMNAESYDLHKKKLSDLTDEPTPGAMKDMTLQQYYEKQGYSYDNSLNSLPMKEGYLAMANRGPNTNGSQFFIITKNGGTPWLEGKHTVFGILTDGKDVLDAIDAIETSLGDKPVEPITFTVEVEVE